MKSAHIVPQVAEDAFVAHNAVLVGDTRIASGASVWYGAVLRADNNFISVGKNSNVQDLVVIHADEETPTIIGENVSVGHGAIIHSAKIDDNSLIGMGAIILNGVHIGKNCLIGAGALVTGKADIPDGSLVIGSPARVKRPLTEEEIEELKENADEYIKASIEFKAGKAKVYE